ncbi:MAG: hypothetical protein ACI35O_01000 [Bacillaceae bacterium]
MSDTVGLILTIVLEVIIFGIINFYTFTYSRDNSKKRIGAGIVFLLLTPLIFFGTLSFVLIFDEGGWGAGLLTMIFTSLYIINGIIVLLSALYLYLKKS